MEVEVYLQEPDTCQERGRVPNRRRAAKQDNGVCTSTSWQKYYPCSMQEKASTPLSGACLHPDDLQMLGGRVGKSPATSQED